MKFNKIVQNIQNNILKVIDIDKTYKSCYHEKAENNRYIKCNGEVY